MKILTAIICLALTGCLEETYCQPNVPAVSHTWTQWEDTGWIGSDEGKLQQMRSCTTCKRTQLRDLD